jgi:hypothetical protein
LPPAMTRPLVTSSVPFTSLQPQFGLIDDTP